MTREPSVVGADVGSDHVLLSDSLAYHGLQGTGLRIWQLLQQPRTVDDLVSALVKEYDVQPDACRTSVICFVEQLCERRLVSIS